MANFMIHYFISVSENLFSHSLGHNSPSKAGQIQFRFLGYSERDPRITGEEALKGHRLIDAILDAAEKGRPAAVVRD